MIQVIMSTGSVYHLSQDGAKTLCGRAFYRAGQGAEVAGRCCKSCERTAEKLTAEVVEPSAPCVSESLGYGACDGHMVKRFGLTECTSCGLTPYNATEGEEHQRITLALDKADGAAWERHHEGVECELNGADDCRFCLASRPERDALRNRAMAGEVVETPTTERSPMNVKVTTRDGERITYAHIPNGDPERVEHFRLLAERSGAFTNITAEPTFPATSNVAVGDGPNGERTLFADSVATVNEWITSGRFHKHSKQQVPTLASICPCDRYKPSEAQNLASATPDTTTPVKAPEKPAWRVVDTNTGQEVTLPTERADFRGDVATIKGIAEPPSPGKSGKLYYDRVGQTVYPQVFDLKIVPAPVNQDIPEFVREKTGEVFRPGVHVINHRTKETGIINSIYTHSGDYPTARVEISGRETHYLISYLELVPVPATMTALAGNGHMMTYNVTGRDADGRLTYTQWDAWHADTCPCNGDGTFDDSF